MSLDNSVESVVIEELRTTPLSFEIQLYHESMVSLVSRRYMRGENGTESLVLHVHENSLDKMSKLKKVKINYSCHGTYKGIHLVFSLFSLHSSENKPRRGAK